MGTDNRIKIPESENDEDFIPDVKAEKEYASEIARENRPIRRKGFGMTERIKRGRRCFEDFETENFIQRNLKIVLKIGKNLKRLLIRGTILGGFSVLRFIDLEYYQG